MSFLLTSESGAQTGWTHLAWPIVRKLAQDFGWQPSGTQPPEGWDAELEAIGEWDGRYTSNDGALVAAQDALAFAAALETALASDDFDERIQTLIQEASELLQSPGSTVTLPSDAATWRKDVEGFAGFCRKGGFRLF